MQIQVPFMKHFADTWIHLTLCLCPCMQVQSNPIHWALCTFLGLSYTLFVFMHANFNINNWVLLRYLKVGLVWLPNHAPRLHPEAVPSLHYFPNQSQIAHSQHLPWPQKFHLTFARGCPSSKALQDLCTRVVVCPHVHIRVSKEYW